MKKEQPSDIQIDAMELLQSVFIQLGLNLTVFLQLSLVVFAYYFMSRFLFRPVLGAIVLRSSKVDGLRRTTESIWLETDMLNKEYNIKWKEYETKANQVSIEITNAAKKRAELMMEEAELKAVDYMNTKRLDIEKNADKLFSELSLETTEIEKMINKSLLGD